MKKGIRSSVTDNLISALVNEVKTAQQLITHVRPSSALGIREYKGRCNKIGRLRGRELTYQYIGSGLGNGPYVLLEDGSVKLDLAIGVGSHLFGHSNLVLLETALRASLQDVIMQGGLQPGKEYEVLLELLVRAAGRRSRLKKGWIGTCGTIANENALKIILQRNFPARKIVAFKNNFAGRSTVMAQISDFPECREKLPHLDDVLYVPFYDKLDPNSVARSIQVLNRHISKHKKDIACFVFELVQAEGGVNRAPPEFFRGLFDVCKKNKIAIWVDEVQTFARTRQLFAFETLGLGSYIDVLTIAKALQCGAVLYTEDFNPRSGLLAGTFAASSTSLAAAASTVKMLLGGTSKLKYLGHGGHIDRMHSEFMSALRGLEEGSCKGLIKDCDGIGLMFSLTPFDGTKEKVSLLLRLLFLNGLIVTSCGRGPYKIKFLLPVVIKSKHIEECRMILQNCLQEVARILR